MEKMKKYIIAIVLICSAFLNSFAQINANKDQRINQAIANWVVQSEVSGMTVISNSIPPLGKDCEELPINNGNFAEIMNGWPTGGWCIPDVNEANRLMNSYIYTKQRLPQPSEIASKMGMTLGEYGYVVGRQKKNKSVWIDQSLPPAQVSLLSNAGVADINNYLHFNGTDSIVIKSPDFKVVAGKPHLLSFWVRSIITANRSSQLYLWYDVGLEDIHVGYNYLPNTDGEWKRVSFYFRVPSDMKRAHFTLFLPGLPGEYLDVTDFKLRTTTDEEFASAYKIQRAKYPDHITKTTNEHGKYLASTIAKLEGKMGVPGKPFLIWGVGSSFTNSLDDLESVRQTIRERFPNSPEIVYRKRCGSGTPFDFARGWVQTDVIAEQPDLIISYTGGNMVALEQMLLDIRSRSTADIIIPSLHFYQGEHLTPENINQPVNEEIKKICEKYKAQYVDNRKEIAEWLKYVNKPITSLLADACHQNELGKFIIGENIAAHFCSNPKSGYNPSDLEKRFYLKDLANKKNSADFVANGWVKKNENLQTTTKGSYIKFNFTGNRIDLIGLKASDGGKLKVMIDGLPVDKIPAYKVSYLTPAITNFTHFGTVQYSSKGNADTGPHGVSLGQNVVPQKWTINMLDNEGNYELKGSVTGVDGNGNSKTMFKSNSGQIIIDPALWRNPKSTVKGDNWTFTVSSTAIPVVDFKTTINPGLFSVTLVQNLSNQQHTLELINEGSGVVEVNSFYVFKPMLDN